MTNPIELGVDTFGDVTDAEGAPLPQAQVIRNVIAEGVLADEVGIDFFGVGEHHRPDFAVSAPEIVLAAIACLSAVFLQNLRLGRYIYAVGGNEMAATASGINVAAVKMFSYGTCGALAGVAGVVLAARITTGQPNAGVGYELDAIAAVVIGGTSLSGGVGSIGGTILGALLIGVINNGLDLLNVTSYYQSIVKGVIIVGAVWLDQKQNKS